MIINNVTGERLSVFVIEEKTEYRKDKEIEASKKMKQKLLQAIRIFEPNYEMYCYYIGGKIRCLEVDDLCEADMINDLNKILGK